MMKHFMIGIYNFIENNRVQQISITMLQTPMDTISYFVMTIAVSLG